MESSFALCSPIRTLNLVTEELHLAWFNLIKTFISPATTRSGFIKLGVMLPVVKHRHSGARCWAHPDLYGDSNTCLLWETTQPNIFEPIYREDGHDGPSCIILRVCSLKEVRIDHLNKESIY